MATLKCTQQHTISILFYSSLTLLGGSTELCPPTIIINQNYDLKKMKADEIAYQDVKQEKDPKKK